MVADHAHPEAGLKKDATKELAVLKVKQSVVVSRLSAPA